jgi:aminoglycoside/choline kinase family phosphotransferase
MRAVKQDILRWLRQVLLGPVRDFDLERLEGDASDRNYYRLHLEPGKAGLPETLVVMELQPPFPKGEIPFVDILHTLENAGLGVPRLYGIEQRQGLILLEDLGDDILQKKIQGARAHRIEAFYHEALDIIVRMQCDIVHSSGCIAFRTAFTVAKFVSELDFFKLHYIEGLLGRRIHPDHRRVMNRLFLWLSSLLDRERKVFTHRDFHSRNLIYHCGKLKLLDFQDARMGLAQYDVASLLRDSYVILDDGLMESLLNYHLSQLEERSGSRVDRSRFRFVFDMTSLQRNLKAIGTFAYQAVQRNNPMYLKYIPGTLTHIEKNLDRHAVFAPYRKVLTEYLPFAGT